MDTTTDRWMVIHPVVRVVCFLILSLFLALGRFEHVCLAIALVLLLLLMAGSECIRRAWPMLYRMRWFFLSIIVIYAWMTPGQAIVVGGFDIDAWWLPTIEGLEAGGQRLLALLLMILAVHWLLWVTQRSQLISAIYLLSAPLKYLGLSREKLAVRIALTMEYVPGVQALLSQKVEDAPANKGLARYVEISADVVKQVVSKGDESTPQRIEINVADRPSFKQWLWPVGLFALMEIPVLVVSVF